MKQFIAIWYGQVPFYLCLVLLLPSLYNIVYPAVNNPQHPSDLFNKVNSKGFIDIHS